MTSQQPPSIDADVLRDMFGRQQMEILMLRSALAAALKQAEDSEPTPIKKDRKTEDAAG